MDNHGETGREYSTEEKAATVREARTLRTELGTDWGAAQRVALLGYWVRSMRSWLRQADVDKGVETGAASNAAHEFQRPKQELRAMNLANEILKWAADCFGAALDRHHR